MKSIDRDVELSRVVQRLKAFQDGRQRHLHMAVASPPNGGLSDFLDDVAECGKQIGFITIRVKVDDHRRPDDLLEPLNRALQAQVSRQLPADGLLSTSLDLLDQCRQLDARRKSLLVADISAALRRLREVGSTGRGVTDPLIARLRAIANKIEDDELPFALVIGWDDSFRSWAAQAQAEDVVDRYAPAEVLYADYGRGRGAWPIFKKVFVAAGVPPESDFPGICGSGLPAGEFVSAAKIASRKIDGPLILDVLRARIADPPETQSIVGVSDEWLVRLCLQDEVLSEDPRLGPIIEPRSDGGYVATRDLYATLGLSPPHDIVSLGDRIRQRLEDGDPDLAKETGVTLATLLSGGSFQTSGSGWRLNAIPSFSDKHPLGSLDILLLVSLDGQLDPAQKADAIAFAAAAERSVQGATSLLLVVSYGSRFETQLRRELVAGLNAERISNPRPRDEEESTTRGRFLSVLCMMDLTTDHVVTIARLHRDARYDSDIGSEIEEKLAQHFRAVQRRMPLMSAELVDSNAIGQLIAAAGELIEIPTSASATISNWLIAEKHENKKYVWRWRDDRLLQRIVSLKVAKAFDLSGYYLFEEAEWPTIAHNLASAYTVNLLVWKDNALAYVDPLPLLKQHVQHWRARLEAMFANSSASLRDRFSGKLREATSAANDVDGCEASLDKLIDLAELLEQEKAAEKEAAVSRKERLEAELTRVGPLVDLTPDQTGELDRLRTADPSDGVIEKVRELAATVTLQRDQRQQREARLKPIIRSIESLPVDIREQAKKMLDDDQRPIEEIRAKVEELRVSSPAVEQTSPAEGRAKRVETFDNSTEALGRLAELYRNDLVHFIKVEIKE